MRLVDCSMNADIEEIHRQLHDLRNYLGPVELLLANMEAQLKKSSMELERKMAELEMRLNELARLIEARGEKLPDASPFPTAITADIASSGASA